MKRTILTFTMLPLAAGISAQSVDSLRMEELQEVVVKGVQAQQDAPYAITKIAKAELQEFSKTGKELPFLFSQTPGVLSWSENGLGTGTTYMRIRGSGDSRINVTLDGVPLNSPEDQCVFWANMNSYASLLGGVQIQRGVGSSTNGDGAFGGSISLVSKAASPTPYAEVSGSYGSYNTFNVGGSFSTGLLWDHLVLDAAYHETNTDGFIHGTPGRSGSYYGGLRYLGNRFQIGYKTFGNFEKTGQAWNGVTAGDNDLSLMDGTYGSSTGIHSYKDLYSVGLGRYNTLYETLAYDASGNFAQDGKGNYVTERYTLSDGTLWKKATDNFWQSHNIVSASWDISEHWKASASVHYTHGYGYYNEFRPNNKLSKFGLSTFTNSEGATVKRADFIRKKGLAQDTYGLIWNANYKDERWDVVGGMSLQQFDGNHFGYLTYCSNSELSKTLLRDGDHKYYDSDANKDDYSGYLKGAWLLLPHLSIFGDVQYRHVNYKTDGINDKFYANEDGSYTNQGLNIDQQYDFTNLKGGISYKTERHHLYASLATSHREPERNNFTDNGSYPFPRAEKLLDYELGYSITGNTWHAGVNLYYMDYTDQFVQTGAVSDIGEALTTNIKDSYRAGVELEASWSPLSWLTVSGNAAFSKNTIKDFDEVVEDWDNGERTIHYDNSTLAFSPSTILNGFLQLHHKGWQAVWHTNFVSRQYLDNTENKERSLPCYSTSNLSINRTFKVSKALGMKEVTVGMNFNNLFGRHYASSGWVYSAICESYGHSNDNRYYQIGYIPMAGFTAMGTLTLKF
ncbi:MAG: TonB-dependent receptor plug domain-containing protein [Prevotella sp.]|nr:TonB-dependent receptor plug domain-containing protein [Prevotella sp.]